MSSGPSLYRRHRPRTFADVVGQEHVVRTLANAVEQGKVHHAYLFVGSRGTGKTSMAKILAACLNCESGPTVEPCGACDSCRAIASATSLDVIEMDAASNNSVDDIRELRDRVAYAPVSGRHKVYILDEAHMLSPQAWNAFLKTLEEPPPNTIFVLATTEAGKVLPTVVDRCHRFDFGRPTVEQITGVLRRVAQAEAIEIPDSACALIARGATGSFRDALGTLEQLVTYSGRRVEMADVLAVLGVADADLLFEAADAVAAGEARAALLAVERLAESGRDAARFFGDLEAHGRAVLIVQTLGEVPADLRLTADHDERLAAQAERLTRGQVVRLLDLLGEGQRAVREGGDARVQLELALVKAAAPEIDPSTRALLARIERLEARLAAAGEGGPGPSAGPLAAGPATAPAGPAPGGRELAAASEPPAAAGSPPAPVTSSAPPSAAPPEPPAPAEPRVERTAPAADRPHAAAAAASPAVGRPATAAALAAVARAEPETRDEVAPAPDTAGMASRSGPPADAGELDVDTLSSLWTAVVDSVQESNGLLAALLAEARPLSVEGGEATIGFTESAAFLKRQAEAGENAAALAVAIRAVTGSAVRLAFSLCSEEDAPPPPAAEAAPGPLSDEQWIERFKTEFDAEEIVPDGDDPTPTQP